MVNQGMSVKLNDSQQLKLNAMGAQAKQGESQPESKGWGIWEGFLEEVTLGQAL